MRSFADRAAIDWTALLDRAGPSDRATLNILRQLDALRGPSTGVAADLPTRWIALLRISIVIAAAQTVLALILLSAELAYGAATIAHLPHAGLAGVFGVASVLLGSAIPRDHRLFFLLGTFALTAGAFAHPLVAALPHGGAIASSLLFRGVYPEAFAPAALWQFALVFPSVGRFTTFDVIARRAARAAWVLAAGLFLANLLLAYGLWPEYLALLGRDHRMELFWQVFASAALPALGVIVIRACRAPWHERVKVVRFACAIGAGGGPLLAVGIARTLPAIESWIVGAGVGPWVDGGVLSALTAMPVLATLAVLFDGPFGHRRVPAGSGGWLARLGKRLAMLRARLRPRHHRERLSKALDRVRLARGPREIVAVLRQELQSAAGAATVTILEADALPPGTALLPILEASSDPVDLSRLCEPFLLLPPQDREWLKRSGVTLAAAVRLRDGSLPAVVLFGRPRGEDTWDRSDRWFITTLLTGAAAAWDVRVERRGVRGSTGELAVECVQCGFVSAAEPLPCGCDAPTLLAGLPHNLNDRFLVQRRLGAGGMGVVYLGRDRTLGREVALKTLPTVRDGLVSRLYEEARTMADLNHESLATIYGLEVWRRTPVLVVEYFPAGTLAGVLAAGWMRPLEVVTLGIRLADAMAYMHARGVLHRDVKPSNIGLTADGAAKLLDFGLAAADERPAGTPAYLPPEALDGAQPDVAVDLWGLSTVLLRACGPGDPPPALRAFFRRALAPAAPDRFPSAVELSHELARLHACASCAGRP